MIYSCAECDSAAINWGMVITDVPESDLLRQYAVHHDEKAFTELVRRHLGLVYQVALRKSGGNHAVAEDAGQRVFTLLARNALTLTNHSALLGWLHKTACYTTSEILRAERRRINREQQAFAMDLVESENSPSRSDPDWNSIGPVIDEALAELGDRDREIVLLRYFSDRRFAQIGERLALSENAARMRLDRALEKLRTALKRRGITSTATALGLTLASQATASGLTVPVSLASSIATTVLASSSAATQTGFLTLMITAKNTGWVAGTLAILALSFTGYTTLQLTAEEDRLVAANQREQELKKETQSLESSLTKINGDVAKLAHGTSPPSPKPTKAATSARGAFAADFARLKELITKRQNQLASNPDYQRRWNAATIAAFNLEYQPYYRATGMNTEKISKLEDILMRKAWEANDLRAAAKALNLSEQDPATKAEAALQETAFSLELKSMLSPDEFAGFRQFDQTAMPRRLIDQVAAATYYTSTPLTAEQGVRLKQLLEANDPHLTVAGPAWRQDGIDWNTLLKQSEPILAPEQLKVLRSVAARSQWIGEQIRIWNGWTKP